MTVYFYSRSKWHPYKRKKALHKLFRNAKKLRATQTYSEQMAYKIIMDVAKAGETWKPQWIPLELWKSKQRTWYILDFYCPQLRLAVEIDGVTHKGREKQDSIRDYHLKQIKIKTVRFPADVVLNNPEHVKKQLNNILEARRNAKN